MARELIKQTGNNRNYLINGNFDIWQRATSVAFGAKQYASDRWYFLSVVGTPALIGSRSTDVPTNIAAIYSVRIQRTAGNASAGTGQLGQPIESNIATALAGKAISITFWAKTGSTYSGSNQISVRLATGTGVDEEPSAPYTGQVDIDNTVSLSGVWTKYTVNVGVLAINTREIKLRFEASFTGTAGADDSIYIAQASLNEGSADNYPFNLFSDNLASELQICQRYFQKSYDVNTAIGAMTSAGSVRWASANQNQGGTIMYFYFKSRMRSTPILNIYSSLNGALGFMHNASNGSNLAAQISTVSESGGAAVNTLAALSGNVYDFHWTADAEL